MSGDVAEIPGWAGIMEGFPPWALKVESTRPGNMGTLNITLWLFFEVEPHLTNLVS